MLDFVLVRQVKVGDLLTAATVIVGTLTFLYALLKDRQLRRREYADRIRRSAAETLSGLERWREICAHHFHDVQPLLTDADVTLVKEQDLISTRDSLWRNLVALEARTSERLLSEKLEGAYAGLYGYDPAVLGGYRSAKTQMRKAFEAAHLRLMDATQMDVLNMDAVKTPYTSAHLGNELRKSNHRVAQEFLPLAEKALGPLRSQMLALVEASDRDIVRKRISGMKR